MERYIPILQHSSARIGGRKFEVLRHFRLRAINRPYYVLRLANVCQCDSPRTIHGLSLPQGVNNNNVLLWQLT